MDLSKETAGAPLSPGAPPAQAPGGLAAWLADTTAAGGAARADPTLQRQGTAEDMFDLAAAPVKPVVARLVSADGTSKPIDVMHGDDVTKVGRSKDLPVGQRLDSARLSGLHCELRLQSATHVVKLVDTSTNGVWLNGARVTKGEEYELHAGDTVRLLNPALAVPAGTPTFEYLFQQVKPKATKASLVDDLTCSVCRCIYHRPVTAIPCLHTFCAHCLSAWVKTGARDCAECRTPMREIRPSHKLASLVEDLVKAHPELRRSADDLKAADEANTIPPLGMVLSKRGRGETGYGSDGEYDSDDSDGYGDDASSGSSSSSAPAAGIAAWAPAPTPYKLPMFFSAPPSSCAQCATPNPADGFTCPPHGPHLRCFMCKTAFPDRPLCDTPQRCDLCNQAFCDLYLGGCKNPGGVGYLQPVGDHNLTELPLGSLFLGNTVEQGILIRYLATAKVDVPTLWALCVEKLKAKEWVPDLTSVKGPIRDATVCRPCAQRVFSSLLYHFRRAVPRDSMPPEVAARPDCWYGMQCRTMKHNTQHAQAYNHVCPNVKRKE